MDVRRARKGTALITGASEGIGWELARIMAEDGWNLVLTARREHLLQDLAKDISERFDVETSVYATDLSDPVKATSLFEHVQSLGLSINALVNNAGFGMIGKLNANDPDRIRQLLQLNIVSLTTLTRLFLPVMIERREGRIMNVGSVAGLLPMPLFAVYAASKAYVRSFTEALSIEINGTGVTATLLAPGPTTTGFGRVAGYKKSNKAEFPRLTAQQVARLGYRAMMAGEPNIITGKMNKIISIISATMPRRTTAKLAMKGMMRKMSL